MLKCFRVNIVYIDKDGKKTNVRGKVGDNVLYLAHRYGVEMEGMYKNNPLGQQQLNRFLLSYIILDIIAWVSMDKAASNANNISIRQKYPGVLKKPYKKLCVEHCSLWKRGMDFSLKRYGIS